MLETAATAAQEAVKGEFNLQDDSDFQSRSKCLWIHVLFLIFFSDGSKPQSIVARFVSCVCCWFPQSEQYHPTFWSTCPSHVKTNWDGRVTESESCVLAKKSLVTADYPQMLTLFTWLDCMFGFWIDLFFWGPKPLVSCRSELLWTSYVAIVFWARWELQDVHRCPLFFLKSTIKSVYTHESLYCPCLNLRNPKSMSDHAMFFWFSAAFPGFYNNQIIDLKFDKTCQELISSLSSLSSFAPSAVTRSPLVFAAQWGQRELQQLGLRHLAMLGKVMAESGQADRKWLVFEMFFEKNGWLKWKTNGSRWTCHVTHPFPRGLIDFRILKAQICPKPNNDL